MARPGTEFVFAHACEVAGRCPVAQTCQNLELGRRYRVVGVRPVHHDTCTEHEGGVRAVDVEVLPIDASLDAARLRGTLVKWTPPYCVQRGCPNWDTCFNPAMRSGADYRVDATLEKLSCPMGYDLHRIRVSENRKPRPP